MKTIDARGLSCPEPVVLLRTAMASGEDSYQIIVDNHASRRRGWPAGRLDEWRRLPARRSRHPRRSDLGGQDRPHLARRMEAQSRYPCRLGAHQLDHVTPGVTADDSTDRGLVHAERGRQGDLGLP